MSLAQRLSAAGQPHLAAALERLPEEGRRTLAAEVEALDLDLVRRLVDDLLSAATPRPSAARSRPRIRRR